MADGNGAAMPQLETLAQYVKDLSFENPNAPRSLAPRAEAPGISVQVNVEVKPLAEAEYEVNLSLEGKAAAGEDMIFRFDLAYAGIFRLVNIPAEHVQQVLMVECPRHLFPFARAIVAEAVRDGGFPPFLLQPIDFASLYQIRQQELARATA